MSVYPYFQGGLGNQMFQLASTWSFTRKTRRPFNINTTLISAHKHSSINYFDNLFSGWKPYYNNEKKIELAIDEHPQFHPLPFERMLLADKKKVTLMKGYFQSCDYIEPYDTQFASMLCWDGFNNIEKYDELNSSVFIHVRGGDYLQSGGTKEFHHIDMTNYYKRAVDRIKADVAHAYIFTNDVPYYESLQCFDDIRTTLVKGDNEVHELYIMTKCGKGGVATNSTFSWWGEYLNKTRPHLYLPSKWFNNVAMNTRGYYFKEAIILSVD
jgi:hypothetical protein